MTKESSFDSQKVYKYVISRKKRMEKLIQKSLPDILDQIGRDTVHKIQVFIRQYWYNKYYPKNYIRSETLLNSVNYSVEGNTVHIYMEPQEYGFHEDFRPKFWGSYTDFDDNPSFDGDDYLAFVNYIDTGEFPSGAKGSIKNPRRGHGIDFVGKTNNWLSKYLDGRISQRIDVLINDAYEKSFESDD